MSRLIVYDGARSIGGTKILIEDQGRVLLEFGKNFVAEGAVFGDGFPPAADKRCEILQSLKLLPDLGASNYILARDPSKTAPNIDAILLSHAHRDHDGAIGLLDPRIPVYGTAETGCLYSRNMKGNEKERRVEVLGRAETPIFGLKVRAVRVDHSIPGACGFLVTTSDGRKFGYTGDLRLHGSRECFADTLDFIQQARDFDPDLLITEGTNIAEYSNEAEESHEGSNAGTLRAFLDTELQLAFEHGGMVVVGVSANNVERINTIYEAVCDHPGARLHLSVFNALLLDDLDKVTPDDPDRPLTPDGPHRPLFGPSHIVKRFKDDKDRVLLYERKAGELKEKDKDGRLQCFADQRRQLVDDYGKGDKALQKGAVFLLYDGDIMELARLAPRPCSKYIHCQSEPFDDEQQLDNARLQGWLKRCDLTYHQIHVSGHIYGSQLKEAIRLIDPRVVLPLHTLHPEHFRDVLPGEGRCLILTGGSVDQGEVVDLERCVRQPRSPRQHAAPLASRILLARRGEPALRSSAS